MKILIIQDHLRMGGTERQSLFLAGEFGKLGHAAVLLLFRPGGHLYGREMRNRPDMRILQPFDTGISLWAPGLLDAVRAIDPGIILCMGRTANCYAGYLQGAFPGKPVVATLRTGKRLFALHRWSLARVRAILVNSHWWKDRLSRTSLPAGKIHVVYNALLQDRAEDERQSARSALRGDQGIAPGECVFLNVASFRRGKRQIDTLRAFARINHEQPGLAWRLWLVGDGPELGSCRKWASRHGLDSKVRFWGSQLDPFPFYAAADVAVSTSGEDSLPNFLIEAQACGLPVVAFDCRGVRETFAPGETGMIVPAGDQAGLVGAITTLATDPGRLESFSRQAPGFARRHFSGETQVRRILALMENLVNPPA